jgi:BlaI family transcriptional regulator, penicillinase repressor
MSPIKITEAEWEVMNAVWARSPLTAGEIVAALGPATGWHGSTIRTLVLRLLKKKALKTRPGSRPCLYEPRISREEGVRQESQSFIERVFDGEPAAMLVHLVGQADLSKEEIRQLKKLLAEKGK